MTFTSRSFAAALALALYVTGAFVTPLNHVIREHSHTAIQETALGVDPTQLIDPLTGRVDLDKLATALGMNGTHDESKPHSHGGSTGHGPLSHGGGSLEHFGVALLAASFVAFVPSCPAPTPAPFQPDDRVETPTPEPQFFAVQRAQAPPV